MRKILLAILIAFSILFVKQSTSQEPPEGVLVLQPGGYAFTDQSMDFSAFTDEGITAELWFYLTDIPKDRTNRWLILGKTGEYSLAISGKSPFAWDDPNVTVYVENASYDRGGGGSNGFTGILPEDSPLNNWVHIVFQIKGKGPVYRSIFYNGGYDGIDTLETGNEFSNTINPLFIGGCPDCESIQGWIGEVRISKGWRYQQDKPKNVLMPFQPDEKTIALWHFDEPFGANSWEDSSGNGHTLFAEGTLSVDNKSKSATTWGDLKK